MRKPFLLLSLLAASVFTMHAQYTTPLDTLPSDSLIISECMFGPNNPSSWGYAELTNMSSHSIDLSHYFIQTSHQAVAKLNGQNKVSPKGILAPGQSWTILQIAENVQTDPLGNVTNPQGFVNPAFIPMSNQLSYRKYQQVDSTGARIASFGVGGERLLLFKRRMNPLTSFVDSVLNDQFGSIGTTTADAAKSISGIAEGTTPMYSRIWVRKWTVKRGSTDWDLSRGTDLTDSEWLPLPRTQVNLGSVPYTTYGVHKPVTTLPIKNPGKFVFNMANKTISVPYGIRRDSAFRAFVPGDNLAWEYVTGNDSGNYVIANGDSIRFFLLNNTLNIETFAITVQTPASNYAAVKPLVYKNSTGNYIRKFDVSSGYSPDSISNVAFAQRVDTLIKYLVFEPNTTYKLLYANNVVTPDLKSGDKLEVTAADNVTKKVYNIAVNPYYPSRDSLLSGIIFPTLNFLNATFDLTDTLQSFKPLVFKYFIDLPESSVLAPPVIPIANNSKAGVYVTRATNLFGTEAERTSTIEVKAEDPTHVAQYQVVFNIKQETPGLKSEPFIVDIAQNWARQNHMNLQIFNPSDEPVDFSDYVLFMVDKGDKLTFENSLVTDTNKNVLRPGFVVSKDGNGLPVFKLDVKQKNPVIGAREVYSAASGMGWPWDQSSDADKATYGPLLDYTKDCLPKENKNTIMFPNPGNGTAYVWMKILNDSVKDGIKPMNTIDTINYKAIDVVNGFGSLKIAWTLYDKRDGRDTIIDWTGISGGSLRGIYRKPNVYTGNPVDRASFGFGDKISKIVEKPAEWVNYGNVANSLTAIDQPGTRAVGRPRFENHTMITYVNVPYITSAVYLIEKGLDGVQNIYGVTANTTVSAFKSNVTMLDPNMKLVFTDALGQAKDDNAVLVAGDKLLSTSADGRSSVSYKINVGVLDAQNTVTSTKYTVTNNGSDKGTIAGIPFGSTLINIIDNLVKPELATLDVTDGRNMVIPLAKYSKDTITVQGRTKTEVLASPAYTIEVVAQNGSTRLYTLAFAASAPQILSDVYTVSQSAKTIDFITDLTVESFVRNLKASPGCFIKVLNKMAQERTFGPLAYDDVVTVSNGTETVSYHLNFMAEPVELRDAVVKTTSGSIVSAFPNPSNGVFRISNLKGVSTIDICDVTGKVLKVINVTGESQSVNMSGNAAGIYFLRLKMAGGMDSTLKMTIK